MSEPWMGRVRVTVGKVECLQEDRVPGHNPVHSIRCRLPSTTPFGAYNVSIHVPGIGFSILGHSALHIDRDGTVAYALQVGARITSVVRTLLGQLLRWVPSICRSDWHPCTKLLRAVPSPRKRSWRILAHAYH